jgi:hypothetical protein
VDQNLAAGIRAIGDDATAVLRIFQWSGHTHSTTKLKVSSLRCFNLLVAGNPILRITGGSSSAHPRFSSWSLAETLCCVPSLETRSFHNLLVATLAALR